MSNPSVGDKARYAAERVMEPILRRWFEIDLEPVNLDSNAENAAVDLSWALESAGLLLPIELVVPEERAPTQTKVGDQVDWRAMALRRAAAPPVGALRQAIATIEDSRQTHVEWIEYLAKYGNDLRPHEEIAGDTAHHREAVEQYEQVLSVLRAALASTEAPESPKRKVSYTSSDARPAPVGERVPEGWRVEWIDRWVTPAERRHVPILVPDTPHEGEPE